MQLVSSLIGLESTKQELFICNKATESNQDCRVVGRFHKWDIKIRNVLNLALGEGSSLCRGTTGMPKECFNIKDGYLVIGKCASLLVATSVTRWWNKKLPNFPNIAPKVAKSFLHKSCIILNSPKSYQNVWDTFVSNFVTKKFRRSPNLVTLVASWDYLRAPHFRYIKAVNSWNVKK